MDYLAALENLDRAARRDQIKSFVGSTASQELVEELTTECSAALKRYTEHSEQHRC